MISISSTSSSTFQTSKHHLPNIHITYQSPPKHPSQSPPKRLPYIPLKHPSQTPLPNTSQTGTAMILSGTPDIADLHRDRLMIENRTWNATVTSRNDEALDPISLTSHQVKTLASMSPQNKPPQNQNSATNSPSVNPTAAVSPTINPTSSPTSSPTSNNRPKTTSAAGASSNQWSSSSPASNSLGPIVQVKHTFFTLMLPFVN